MIVTCEQMREAEEAAFARGVSAAQLMDEAGAGIAHVILQFFPEPAHAVLYLGKGNNAGDALVAARHLAERAQELVALLQLGVFLDGHEIDRAHGAEALTQRVHLRLHLFPIGRVERLQVILGGLALVFLPLPALRLFHRLRGFRGRAVEGNSPYRLIL